MFSELRTIARFKKKTQHLNEIATNKDDNTKYSRGGVSKEQKTQTKTEHLPQKNNPPWKMSICTNVPHEPALHFFPPLQPLDQGSSNLILEGRCPAEFSSNLPQHTCMEASSIPSKTLISCFRCVWLGLELNSAGTPALQDRTWWPLL